MSNITARKDFVNVVAGDCVGVVTMSQFLVLLLTGESQVLNHRVCFDSSSCNILYISTAGITPCISPACSRYLYLQLHSVAISSRRRLPTSRIATGSAPSKTWARAALEADRTKTSLGAASGTPTLMRRSAISLARYRTCQKILFIATTPD